MNESPITEAMLSHLPEPAQRYMRYTGEVGSPWIETARLKQVGKFRLAPERPWMSVSAVETYTTDPPGFRWDARFKVAGLPLLRAGDSYQNGHGHMVGVLAGLKTIFDLPMNAQPADMSFG